MNRPDSQWIGRRWFEMRVGYGTYMGFTFGFANFILLLHGLTDWFRDYPVHWFGIAMLAVIVPASVLIGHRHNRTQQKTEGAMRIEPRRSPTKNWGSARIKAAHASLYRTRLGEPRCRRGRMRVTNFDRLVYKL